MTAPETRPPRAGEELDLGRLTPYLQEKLGVSGELQVSQFPGGHSNLTYLIEVDGRELVLRRPPFGSKVKSAHDMLREARVLSRLAPVWPKAPRPVLVCDDDSILGARFYLMERVRGPILRRQPPPGLALDQPACARLADSFVDTFAELHAIDWQAIGLADFGHPEGYVERQVSGWSKRWNDARTDEIPDMERASRWLAEHLPPSPTPSIVHNDFKYDNLVLDAGDVTKVTKVLDWEMATIGDPLMDLGTSLSYWVEADDPPQLRMLQFGPTSLPGTPSRREIAEKYAARTGRDLVHIRFYYVFGLFKNAVVGQQIYFRYQQGLTHDERFAILGPAVALMARLAMAATNKDL